MRFERCWTRKLDEGNFRLVLIVLLDSLTTVSRKLSRDGHGMISRGEDVAARGNPFRFCGLVSSVLGNKGDGAAGYDVTRGTGTVPCG